MITKDEINSIIWRACDTFRGTLDSSEYKDYILTMLFIKYLSDLQKDRLKELKEKYGDNERRIKRALEKEKFIIGEDATFEYLYKHKEGSNLGRGL